MNNKQYMQASLLFQVQSIPNRVNHTYQAYDPHKTPVYTPKKPVFEPRRYQIGNLPTDTGTGFTPLPKREDMDRWKTKPILPIYSDCPFCKGKNGRHNNHCHLKK